MKIAVTGMRHMSNVQEKQVHKAGKALFETLLETFRSSYDIEENCSLNGEIYDAYASFNATSAKYVLLKKAELWRANCFEHVFFRLTDCLDVTELQTFQSQIRSYIEPNLVRGGNKYPKPDHMYTYMTAIFICEQGISEKAEKEVRHFRYVRNYLLTIRGYSEAKVLVFDLKTKRIFGNRAAREAVKGFRKAGIL